MAHMPTHDVRTNERTCSNYCMYVWFTYCSIKIREKAEAMEDEEGTSGREEGMPGLQTFLRIKTLRVITKCSGYVPRGNGMRLWRR